MKRRLFKLVLFLLLGAIVNVAVAWGCAALMDLTDREGEVGSSPLSPYLQWTIARYEGSGAGWVTSSTEERYLDDFPSPTAEELAPPWANLRRAPPARSERAVRAHGWPAISLWCEFIFDPYNGPGYITQLEYGGIPTHPTNPRLVFNSITQGEGLPLVPIWPGFAINTIFYAAILWLLTFSPFVARRIIRRKRGHCLKCGYDLRGASGGGGEGGCPECGWRREEKVEA